MSSNSCSKITFEPRYPRFDGFEEPEDLLWVYVNITFAGAVMMILCSLWLTHSLDKEAQTISKRILTVADFSLLFTGLPEENLKPKELARFLTNHGLDIFDLRIARADGALIDLFKNRSKIVNNLEIAHQRVRIVSVCVCVRESFHSLTLSHSNTGPKEPARTPEPLARELCHTKS